MFNPADWYWIKQDGKVYSSARQREYAPSNTGYKEWRALGNRATPYPTDIGGNDSEAELASVLAAHGLTLRAPDPKALAIERLTASCAAAIVGGYLSSALGEPHTYPSGITDQINMMGSVTASLLPGVSAEWQTPFWCADAAGLWEFRGHTAAQIQSAGSDGKAHVVTCQGTLEALVAQAIATETAEDLDAIVWPLQD